MRAKHGKEKRAAAVDQSSLEDSNLCPTIHGR